MFIKLKKSGLYKSLLKKFRAMFRQERNTGQDGRATIKTKEIINQSSYPDAIWHRSKSARFRQN